MTTIDRRRPGTTEAASAALDVMLTDATPTAARASSAPAPPSASPPASRAGPTAPPAAPRASAPS